MCATKLTGAVGIPKYSKGLTGPSRKKKDTLRLNEVFLLREQNLSSNQDGDENRREKGSRNHFQSKQHISL